MRLSGSARTGLCSIDHLLKIAFACALISVFAGWPLSDAAAQNAARRHPLDPLTKQEISIAVGTLKSAGKITPDTRFATIYLKEPPKSQVLADIAEGRSRRAAFALLYNWATRIASEAVEARSLERTKIMQSGQPLPKQRSIRMPFSSSRLGS